MTEQEYFNFIYSTINKRNQLITEKCGDDFVKRITEPEIRDWYYANIAKYDQTIVNSANYVCKILNLNLSFNSFKEVAQNKIFVGWYMKKLAEKNNVVDNENLFCFFN